MNKENGDSMERINKENQDSMERMNKENQRKEFFRVSLDEIARVVHETDEELKICKSKVTFTMIAEAADYRKTMARERQNKIATVI